MASGEHDVLQWLQEEISKSNRTKVRVLLELEAGDEKSIINFNRGDCDRGGSQARRAHFA